MAILGRPMKSQAAQAALLPCGLYGGEIEPSSASASGGGAVSGLKFKTFKPGDK